MSSAGDVLVGHQPAYLPWPGYFARLLDVDRFLLLDHVQFSARGWQQRNYIRGRHGERRVLTVPVRQRFGQPITDVRIAGDTWSGRHWRILEQAYRRAPFWPEWAPRLHAVYHRPWQHLVSLNVALTRLLLDGFGIEVQIVTSSSLKPTGRKTEMLVDLCRRTGATSLRVGAGATAYLDTGLLRRAGIGVQIAGYRPASLAEGRGLAVGLAGLSALDLLLYCGPDARDVLARGLLLRPWPRTDQGRCAHER
jgi:hypothetical protein